MTTLTIERLKAKQSTPLQCGFEYDGEQWDFFIKRLTESGRCALEAKLFKDGKPVDNYTAKLRVEHIAAMVCDADGNLLFADRDGKEFLQNVDAGITARLWDAVEKHSGLYDAGDTKKKSDD